MNSLNNAIDRFCRKHPGFGIPNLMRYIIIGTAAVYLMDWVSTGPSLSSLLAFSRAEILQGELWRLVTFVFVPQATGWGMVGFAITLYFYYFIGNALEREWGAGRFTVFYLFGIVLNIVVGMVVGTTSMFFVNMSMFFAFATLYPNLQFLLFFVIPVKAKWLAWVDAAYFLFIIARNLLGGHFLYALIPVVAVLNYFVFFYEDFARLFGRVKYRTSGQTINFKKAQKQAQKNAKANGYMHKCAVCGKTDAEYPDMEFRYCSKCNGYYCYCMDHINNHIHIE